MHFLLALCVNVCYIIKTITKQRGPVMLTITKTNTRTDVCTFAETTTKFTDYTVTGTVQLAGDSIWDYAGTDTVDVTGVTVIETTYADGDTSTMVNATHNTTWDIYTDTGFERAISKLVGFEVTFTEQGMQDDNYASLEA